MKLRIRSLNSKETLKLEVPNTCTVRELKEILSSRLSNGGSSSPISPDQFCLTLNRKDELSGSSLQSAGVASGDLIFYSLNPNPDACSSQTVNIHYQIDGLDILGNQDARGVELKSMADEKSAKPDARGCQSGELIDAQTEEWLQPDAQVSENGTLDSLRPHNAPDVSLGNENSGGEVEGVEDMEVEDDDDDECLSDSNTTFSVPTFLKKVFEDEIGLSSDGADGKLLKVAVHAVLLESGFVGYDPISCTKLDGFRLPDRYPFSALRYTIPEILSSNAVQSVALKFQSLGKFVNIVGSLASKDFVYRVCLDGSRFAPALNLVWKNGGHFDNSANERSGEHVMLHPKREVFEFWKSVKDGIALPLLIDLCENVGLVPPSCFMLLPTELKLKILELLSGPDVARTACICTELRFISSNDALWRKKYEEQFGTAVDTDTGFSWKFRFSRAWAWERRKKMKRACIRMRRIPGFMSPYYPLRERNPFGIPYMIGGDYDRVRVPSPPPPFGHYRLHFTPNCNLGLGGFNH